MFINTNEAMYQEDYTSWAMLAIQKTINREDVRNRILVNTLKNISGVVYGRSIEMDLGDENEVERYIDLLIDQEGEKTYLFSVANIPDKKTAETHWQTFMLEKKGKILWGFNPGEDLYESYAADYYVFPATEKHKGYRAQWCRPSTTCQTTSLDVFCQTWSLWLQIKAMKTRSCGTKRTIIVPADQDKRWTLIIKFWKDVIKDNFICSKLKAVYKTLINEKVKSDADENPQIEYKWWVNARRKWGRELLGVNPCSTIQGLSLKDLRGYN